MDRRLSFVAIALLISLSLAGCLGDKDDAVKVAGATTDADTTGGNTTTGDNAVAAGGDRHSVEGYVRDAVNLPIPGATVMVQNTNISSQTDDTGRYSVAGLADNEVYVLIGAAPGYAKLAQQLVAVDDKVVRLDFTLTALATEKPFKSTLERSGLISCEVIVVATGVGDNVERGCSAGTSEDPNAVDVLDFAIPEDVAGVVVEMSWDASSDLSKFLRMEARTTGYGDLDTTFGTVISSSSLQIEIPQQLVAKFYNGAGGGLQVLVDAHPEDDDEAAAGAAFAFQQPFDVVITLFFVDPNPPGYSHYTENGTP